MSLLEAVVSPRLTKKNSYKHNTYKGIELYKNKMQLGIDSLSLLLNFLGIGTQLTHNC